MAFAESPDEPIVGAHRTAILIIPGPQCASDQFTRCRTRRASSRPRSRTFERRGSAISSTAPSVASGFDRRRRHPGDHRQPLAARLRRCTLQRASTIRWTGCLRRATSVPVWLQGRKRFGSHHDRQLRRRRHMPDPGGVRPGASGGERAAHRRAAPGVSVPVGGADLIACTEGGGTRHAPFGQRSPQWGSNDARFCDHAGMALDRVLSAVHARLLEGSN